MTTEQLSLAAQRICFIGAGNMASALIGGLVNQGIAPENIIAAEPSQERLDDVHKSFGVSVSTDNASAVAQSNIIVLCVKPQVLRPVCEALAPALPKGSLVISIAAGIELSSLQAWCGEGQALVRCMPNTPALVGKGASGLYANALVSEAQKSLAKELFSAIGFCEWLASEKLIHSVTAVSGSGPAYFFLFIEAMEKAGVEMGLEPETARLLAAQTCAGAAQMVLRGDSPPEQLKRNVMSPGGTTERAIQTFDDKNLSGIVTAAMQAAHDRSVEMAQELKG